jgi:membrane protease YdiL (CAAX protease family)
VLGIANLVANRAIALMDISIYQQMTEQWAGFSPWSMIVAEPLVEEIGFRLVLMGGVAWLLTHMTDDRRTVFVVALAVSSLLFGLAHIVVSSRPVVDALHATAVALKTGTAGAFLGWAFWRWGLPYSVACHSTANAVHLVAAPLLF